MRIMVKPATEADVVMEGGGILTAAGCPPEGLAVELTLWVRRRIAAGELLNVTPAGGVPDQEPGPAEPEQAKPQAAARPAAPAASPANTSGVS